MLISIFCGLLERYLYYDGNSHSSSQHLEIKTQHHLETATQILLLLTLNMEFSTHLLACFADLIPPHFPVVDAFKCGFSSSLLSQLS